MNAANTLPVPLQRSEAFAEDILEFVERGIEPVATAVPMRWLVNLAPLAVALMGVAFAVVPPLA